MTGKQHERRHQMALINTWNFVKTVILWDVIAQATFNQYRVVSARPYVDKKGKLPEGLTLTLMVLKDKHDYGVDKNGMPRENNVYQNFDATVLNRKHQIKKGDVIRLLDFDEENSYAIGFDLLLRFRDCEIVQPQGGKNA